MEEPTAKASQLDGLLDVVDSEKELSEKREQLHSLIQELEQTRTTVNKSIEYLGEVQKTLSETFKAFNAAKDSADNIISGIVAQIVKVERTHFKAHLDEDSVHQVQETNKKAIEHESAVLDAHIKKEARLWREQADKMHFMLRNNEGVWLSQKLFYIIAPMALLSIFAWVICLSFWIYFHWIV